MSASAQKTDLPVETPLRLFAPEIKGFSKADLEDFIKTRNLEKNTLQTIVKDPRIDIYDALLQCVDRQDLDAVKAIVEVIQQAPVIDYDMVGVSFRRAAFGRQYDKARYLADCFWWHLPSLIQEAAFELAHRQELNNINHDFVLYLLRNDMLKINAQDSTGSTMLHIASKAKREEFCKILMDNLANPFIRDSSGLMAGDNKVQDLPNSLNNFAEYLEFPSSCDLYEIADGRLRLTTSYESLPFAENEISKETNWVRMEETNDMQFTLAISRASKYLGYTDEAVKVILQFLSQTFLEQYPPEKRLRFRQTSYNTLPESLGLQQPKSIPLVPGAAGGKAQQANATVKDPESSNIVSIVIPYIHVISKADFYDQRKYWDKWDGKTTDGEVPFRVDSQSIFNMHVPRSLDESYFIGLSSEKLSRRNDDQVFSRGSAFEGDRKPILMVSQLWLWSYKNMVISAVPSVGMLVNPISKITQEWERNIHPGQALSRLQLTALILSETINMVDLPRSRVLPEPIFYAFERAIAEITDEVSTYMKEMDMDSIRIEEEKRFIHIVDDIREELSMIKDIVDQQSEIWTSFYEEHKEAIKEWDRVLLSITTRPQAQLPKFLRRIEKIDKDAERVQNSIITQLGLKTDHASLKESRNSTYLSTSVIGFTIVTLVFTPLSFLCSLFALPAVRFQQNQLNNTGSINDESYGYSNSYLGRWMAVGEVVSLLVTGAFVWFSFLWLKGREKVGVKYEEKRPTSGLRSGASLMKDDIVLARDRAMPGGDMISKFIHTHLTSKGEKATDHENEVV